MPETPPQSVSPTPPSAVTNTNDANAQVSTTQTDLATNLDSAAATTPANSLNIESDIPSQIQQSAEPTTQLPTNPNTIVENQENVSLVTTPVATPELAIPSAPAGIPVYQPSPHHPHQESWRHWLFHWWHKIATFLLIGHGLIDLFESLYFVTVEYKELDHQIKEHLLTEHEANSLFAAAIIIFVSAMVNIFFALRLNKVKETTAHNIDLIIATILIISTRKAQEYLIALDLINYIITFL